MKNSVKIVLEKLKEIVTKIWNNFIQIREKIYKVNNPKFRKILENFLTEFRRDCKEMEKVWKYFGKKTKKFSKRFFNFKITTENFKKFP